MAEPFRQTSLYCGDMREVEKVTGSVVKQAVSLIRQERRMYQVVIPLTLFYMDLISCLIYLL